MQQVVSAKADTRNGPQMYSGSTDISHKVAVLLACDNSSFMLGAGSQYFLCLDFLIMCFMCVYNVGVYCRGDFSVGSHYLPVFTRTRSAAGDVQQHLRAVSSGGHIGGPQLLIENLAFGIRLQLKASASGCLVTIS